MRDIILLFLLAVTNLVTAQNEYRIGDKVNLQRTNCVPVSNVVGRMLLWNFSNCDLLNECSLLYLANKDILVKSNIATFDGHTRYSYNQLADTLFMTAFQNKNVRMKYQESEVDLCFPLSLGDSLNGYFSAVGDDVCGNCVRIFGKYYYDVSGEGTLITMDKDTLVNVILVHNSRMVSSSYMNKEKILRQYGILDNIPVLSHDSIDAALLQDSVLLRQEVYRWYVPGYRYPVFRQETITSSKRNKLLYSVAFYCPPTSLESLSDDSNEDIRKHKMLQESFNAQNEKEFTDDSILKNKDYELSSNLSNSCLILSYELLKEAEVAYGVYTQDGLTLLYHSLGRQMQGRYLENINFSKPQVRNGIFTLFIDGITYSKKINEKCR